MTDIERAIKHYKNVLDDAIVVLDSGFGSKPNECPTFYKRKKLNAELAISALEKQIPKKPINREHTTYFYCPVCYGNRVNDYCADCGQALDWSDTE